MMEPIGTPLPPDGFQHLHWVRDLQWCELPLLVQMRDRDGRNFLWHWCDGVPGKHHDRWLMVPTDIGGISRLLERQKPLRDALTEGPGWVFLVETSEGAVSSAAFVLRDLLPAEYLPRPSSLLDISLIPDDF